METLNRLTLAKLILYSSFVLSLVLTLAQAIKNVDKGLYEADFRAYYVAGTIIKDHNISKLYNYNFQNEVHQKLIQQKNPTIWFLNTPISALLFVPLAYLNFKTAYIAFAVINTALIGISVLILCKKFNIDWTLTAVLVFYFPIISAIHHNQITALLLLIYTTLVAGIAEKPGLSGLYAGLLFLKPQHLLTAPFIFLIANGKQAKKNFVLGFLSAITVLVLSNIFLYGSNVYDDYFTFLKDRRVTLKQQEKYEGNNIHALAAILDPILGVESATKVLMGSQVFLLGIGAALIVKNKKYQSLAVTVSGLIILALTLNLHTKYVDTLVLLIPLLLILNEAALHKKPVFQFVLISVIILIRQGVNAFVPQPYISETLLLLACGFWLLRARAQTHQH